MVGVAQSVEHRIVAPEVVGSIPIAHPICSVAIYVPAKIDDYYMTQSTLPPLFVINLADNQDRRDAMRKQLESLPVEYEFVEAVDGSKLTEEEVDTLCQGQPEEYIARPLVRGEVGCYLSHIKVMKIIVERNIPEAIVLEDDVIINPELVPFLVHRDRIPEHWGILQLGWAYTSHGEVKCWNKHTVKIYRNYAAGFPFPVTFGTQGYFIRQAFCAKTIANAYPIIAPIDHVLFDIYYSLDFFYALTDKPLVSVNGQFLVSHSMQDRALFQAIAEEQHAKFSQSLRHMDFFAHFINRLLYFSKLEKLASKWLVRHCRIGLHKNSRLTYKEKIDLKVKLLFHLKIFLFKSS